MHRIATLLFLLYLALLTAGLLVSNPFALAGRGESWLQATYSRYLEPGGHFLGFLVLGLLASLSRWPRRWTARVALLLVYAFITEGLQTLVPLRTPDVKDLVQNLAGAAMGFAVGWPLAGRPKNAPPD